MLANFAFIAAHNLREPLRMVNEYLGLLKSKNNYNEQELALFMNYASEGARRLEDMVESLLKQVGVKEYAQIQVNTSLSDILTEVIDNLSAKTKLINAKIIIHNSVDIKVNKEQFVQLFQNLVYNGLKFSKKNKPPIIEIMVEHQEGNYLFIVKDNGIGIAETYQKSIFELFQRLHTSNEYEGLGIGLFFCKNVVNSHKGKIWVNSVLGKGSSFCFTLPY